MVPRRSLLAVVGLAVLAAAGPAVAQSATSELRIVEAFRAYCIATAARPARFQGEIERRSGRAVSAGTDHDGNRIRITQVMASIERSDPHRRLTVSIGVVPGSSGPMRRCRVEAAWGKKPDLIAALLVNLPGAGTPVVVLENQAETELTRWTVEVEGMQAVVELRVPTYAGAPDRSLTLLVRGP